MLGTLIAGCGYSVHRHASLPFKAIRIGLIQNRTHEPKLQDRLSKALVEECVKQGIGIDPSAGLTLTGVIHTFTMDSLSEKAGVTAEYRINISADFTITNDKGETEKIISVGSPFIVSFTGSRDFAMLLANRERAEEEAINNIAMQVIGSLMYR